MKSAAIAILVLLSAAAAASADQVVTTDGGQIIGTITKVSAGKMTVHTDALGDVVVPLAKIKTFSTDSAVELHLVNGTVEKQPAQSSEPGEIAVPGGGHVAIADITAINPPDVVWTASALLGSTFSRGNTFTDSLNIDVNAGVKFGDNDFTANAEYLYGRQKATTTGVSTTTIDRWTAGARYDHYFTEKFYGYADAQVTKDRIAFLDLRFTPSVGLGYKWFDKAPLQFSTEGGVAWIYEKYTNGTPLREQVALKLAYHLNYDFNDKVALFNDVTYFPSLQQGRTYLVNADIGIRTKLTTHVFAEAKIEWNYDSTPALGAFKNDTRYIASVGYTF